MLVLGVGIAFAFLDTSAKFLVVSGMPSFFVAWARFFVHLAILLMLFRTWSNRRMFELVNLPAQALRGIFLAGSTIFNFMALQTLQLAETTAIAFFSPMIITALAGPLLGEWAGWRRWLAIAVGFAGVVVITRPGLTDFQMGHAFALCSTLSYSLYAVMTRRMGVRESAESLIFYSALVPTLLMAPGAIYVASPPPDALHWIILLSLGFFGGLGHYMLIRAYKLATATALAPYSYFQMVWMVIAGVVVFDQFPDGWTLAGAGIIVASGLYILHRERRLRLATRTAPNTEHEELAKKL